jgi:hypothetical protein
MIYDPCYSTSDGYSLFHNVYFHVKDYIIPTTNILSIAMVSLHQRFRYVIDSYVLVHVKLPNVSVLDHSKQFTVLYMTRYLRIVIPSTGYNTL